MMHQRDRRSDRQTYVASLALAGIDIDAFRDVAYRVIVDRKFTENR